MSLTSLNVSKRQIKTMRYNSVVQPVEKIKVARLIMYDTITYRSISESYEKALPSDTTVFAFSHVMSAPIFNQSAVSKN